MMNPIGVELKLVSDQKSRKARVDVFLNTDQGELSIAHLSVIQQDGKDPWVAFPTIDFADKKTGEFKHLPIIKPGARLKKAISDAVLAKYREAIND